ncbi:MAG: PfkB family carbohydrate kinase [Sulfuricaulis sp.]|nr:PfkB family carbohydrate kinase [Sulfuricaulis sp.]
MDLDAVKHCKVLVVGDAITDEYVYVTPLGKSIKEPVISTRLERKESFRGGVWAAAAHLVDLCARVDVLTGPRMMVNTRFVDPTCTRKLFTLHEARKCKPVTATYLPVQDYDVVIIADFGHGAMTVKLIAKLSEQARFLAVNAQTNSQNFGFNLINKYPRADFAVLDELEARLAVHDRDSSIEDVIRKLGYPRIIVTRGILGVVGFDGEFHYAKAVASKVVDTMGAGDAVLAVSSPFAAMGVPMKDLVRIGNAAGAVKVGIVGHRQHVTRQALEERLAA